MKKTKCSKCGYEFVNKAGNYKKHFKSCDGTYKPKSERGHCIHCDQHFDLTDKSSGFMGNHVRWCEKNPKREQYIEEARERFSNAEKPVITEESRKKAAEKIKAAWKEGRYDDCVKKQKGKPGRKHSQKTKNLLSVKARESDHRRLKRKMIEYNGVLLDSTWEYELAKRLDELGIKWVRPKPIKWQDKNGLEHHYFPDFYLEEYDLYIDPKNDFAFRVQKEKMDIISNMLENLIILRTLDECENFDPTITK
jgi:hypothetical protein